MPFSVNIDISGFVAQRRALEQRVLPLVTAQALTAVAQDAQAEVRRREPAAFKLKNTWTQDRTLVKPADRNVYPLQSAVYTDTANRTTGAPDYLVRQENGGEKVPFGGHQHIAIPTKYLRNLAPRIIPAALRPKALLPSNATIGQTYKGAFGDAGKRYERISRTALRKLKSSEFVAFLQHDRKGTLCIFFRPGSSRDAVPLYVLVTQANVRKSSLEMAQTVGQVASDRFARQWDLAWRRIYAQGIRL